MKLVIFVFLVLGLMSSYASEELVTCGLRGNLEQRAHDCFVRNGKNAQFNYRARFHGNWELVSKNDNGRMLWRENIEQTLWTSLTDEVMTHADAIEFCRNKELGKDLKIMPNLEFELPPYDPLWVVELAGLGLVQPSTMNTQGVWVKDVQRRGGDPDRYFAVLLFPPDLAPGALAFARKDSEYQTLCYVNLD